MEKETVIAKVRTSFDFTEEYQAWIKEIIEKSHNNKNEIPWFASERGLNFLHEYHNTWDNIFVEESQKAIQEYFRSLNLPNDLMPVVKIMESYRGSWIIDAAVIMYITIGGVYKAVKSISEIPKIAEGLSELKGRISKRFERDINEKAGLILLDLSVEKSLPPPPPNIFQLNEFTIDARPLLALKPSEMKSHKIHLQVGVSRDAFTLENLGDEIIRDLRIGLFKSKIKKNNWDFADAFAGSFGILSPKQTMSKELSEFRNVSNLELTIEETELPLNIDCWVQDNFGIYLFMFYLEN